MQTCAQESDAVHLGHCEQLHTSGASWCSRHREKWTCLEAWSVVPRLLMVQQGGQAADSVAVIGCLLHGRAALQQVSQLLRRGLWHCGHVQQLQQHWQHCPVHCLRPEQTGQLQWQAAEDAGERLSKIL